VDVADDGEQAFVIDVLCTGNDRTFNMAGVSVNGSNLDVSFPRVLSVFPVTVAYIGTQVTIKGSHFGEYKNDIEVFVGGVKVRASPSQRKERTQMVPRGCCVCAGQWGACS
jgi:hypothetical protein